MGYRSTFSFAGHRALRGVEFTIGGARVTLTHNYRGQISAVIEAPADQKITKREIESHDPIPLESSLSRSLRA